MDKAVASARFCRKTTTTATSRQTDRRSTSPTRLEALGPSHRRRGLRQAGSLTRGLHCPGAPVVCESTIRAQQKTRDQGMTKPSSLSSQPSLPTTKTSVEYNTNLLSLRTHRRWPRELLYGTRSRSVFGSSLPACVRWNPSAFELGAQSTRLKVTIRSTTNTPSSPSIRSRVAKPVAIGLLPHYVH